MSVKNVIRIPAHTYRMAIPNEAPPNNSMFLCGETLAEIWEDEFKYGSEWTVCLQKRTAKSRRPYVAAIKLDIPDDFCAHGVRYETKHGRMSQRKLFVHETDTMVTDHNLAGEYWVWVELDND